MAVRYQSLDVRRGVIGRVHREDFSNPVWRRFITRHAHRFLETHLIARGSAIMVVGDRRMDLPSGSMIWFPPRTEHLTLEASPSLRRWILALRVSAVRRILTRKESAFLLASPRTIRCCQLARLELGSLVRILSEIASQAPEGDSLVNAGLAYALARQLEAFLRAAPGEQPSALHPAVARALTLMNGDGLHLRREELAARCRTSETHLSRLFVRELGQPLREVRNRKRLARFQQLMADASCESLTEAALEAGFGSYSQFHRVFRRLTGVSPSKWDRPGS